MGVAMKNQSDTGPLMSQSLHEEDVNEDKLVLQQENAGGLCMSWTCIIESFLAQLHQLQQHMAKEPATTMTTTTTPFCVRDLCEGKCYRFRPADGSGRRQCLGINIQRRGKSEANSTMS